MENVIFFKANIFKIKHYILHLDKVELWCKISALCDPKTPDMGGVGQTIPLLPIQTQNLRGQFNFKGNCNHNVSSQVPTLKRAVSLNPFYKGFYQIFVKSHIQGKELTVLGPRERGQGCTYASLDVPPSHPLCKYLPRLPPGQFVPFALLWQLAPPPMASCPFSLLVVLYVVHL